MTVKTRSPLGTPKEPALNLLDLLWPQLAALGQVLLIDLVLAGDNAVVVGMAVAGLPAAQKSRAILIGIAMATVLRIGCALVTLELLAVVGLIFAGGLLLLWVSWRMYRELRGPRHDASVPASAPVKTMRQALLQIVLADISMSVDNVLAVAGASREHPWVLVLGLTISVVLMGVAARLVADLLERHRWIAWVGLAVVVYVALELIWDGANDISAHLPA